MSVTCDYANAGDTLLVNYHYDANTMTVVSSADQRVLDFVAGGGSIGAYVAPAAPSVATIDQSTLNASLSAPGSIVRGLALVVLDLAKGVIPINASYTQAQLLSAIQQRMR